MTPIVYAALFAIIATLEYIYAIILLLPPRH